MSKDYNWMDYELIADDLKSLSVIVEALGTDTISGLSDKNIKMNCFSIVSNIIYDKSLMVDEMFKEQFEMIKGNKG